MAPDFSNNVDTYYRVSATAKPIYLFGDYHIELIEGDQSVIAHPEYRSYTPQIVSTTPGDVSSAEGAESVSTKAAVGPA